MYKITNVAENTNLVVNNKTLKYNDSIYVDEETLESLEKIINNGTLIVEKKKVKRIEIKPLDINSESFKRVKDELVEIFFKFHANVPLQQEELKKLIWFHKNVSPISSLPESLKSYLDDINDSEELIEVLINHIYPILIDNFLKME